MSLRPPAVSTVRAVVAATIVFTAFHFADNYFAIETYPGPSWQPEWFDVVVLVSWPIFTALGIAGYRAYRRGSFFRAHALLLAYSYTGLVSIGHFFYASPSELTTRGLVSVLIDIAMGTLVLAIAAKSIVARRRRAPTATA